LLHLLWTALFNARHADCIALGPHAGQKVLSLQTVPIAAIVDPQVIVKILTHLGLPARAPPRAPARPFPLFQAA